MATNTKLRFVEAERHLSRVDPVMKRIITQVGHCGLQKNDDTFYVLCDSIISQQLSVKASATILQRFCGLFPKNKPTPELLRVLPDDEVRAVGCSQAKVRYLKDLAEKFLDGTLQPNTFGILSDEELIETLVQVKGIGRWTAEMYLIASLNRPDVLAVDDLGLRKAMMELYKLPNLPKPEQMHEIAEVWKPFRSVASWYLWHHHDNRATK